MPPEADCLVWVNHKKPEKGVAKYGVGDKKKKSGQPGIAIGTCAAEPN